MVENLDIRCFPAYFGFSFLFFMYSPSRCLYHKTRTYSKNLGLTSATLSVKVAPARSLITGLSLSLGCALPFSRPRRIVHAQAASADLFFKVCGSPHRACPRATDLQNRSQLRLLF